MRTTRLIFPLSCVCVLLGGCYHPEFRQVSSSDSDSSSPFASATGFESSDSLAPSTSEETDLGQDEELICGDGKIAPGEECDDGNMMDSDACLSTCKQAKCGDGIVWLSDEECDDGNSNNDDSCLNTCTSAKCGDGFLHEDQEECDAGSDNIESDYGNKGSCTSQCNFASYCGDGIVQESEECDDGNSNDHDACPNTCKHAECGDGIVWDGVEECDHGPNNVEGEYGSEICTLKCALPKFYCGDGFVQESFEECDDGSPDGDDLCNSCKKIPYKYIFVSQYTLFGGQLGHVSMADDYCIAIAIESELSTESIKWLAWISDSQSSIKERYLDKDFNGWYVLPGNPPLLVAKGWAGLTSGSLKNPIFKTAIGEALMSGTAWTYTSASGDSMETAYHCDIWQSISASAKGHVGDITATDTQWTDKGPGETATCNTQHHLYCIQD